MKADTKTLGRAWRGFTLIELLTVISIIGILAAMIIPAVVVAKTKAQKAVARKDMHTIIGAINQYQATYSRMPAAPASRNSLTVACPDFTYGTALKGNLSETLWNKRGEPLARIGNKGSPYGSAGVLEANNSELVAILHNLDRFPDDPTVPTVNAGFALNPQKQDFLDGFKEMDYQRRPGGGVKALYKGGGIGPDGVLRDPWGSPFIITVDLNYDNRCRDGMYRKELVSGQGGDVGFKGLRRTQPRDFFEGGGSVIVWSFGPDGLASDEQGATVGVNKDNLVSWE